jgi:hypothetical protein
MMTVGQHDELWMAGAKALPGINIALDTANLIACAKELYALGEITKEGYIDLMTKLLERSGYTLNKNK